MDVAVRMVDRAVGAGRIYPESSKDGADDRLDGGRHDTLGVFNNAPDKGSLVCGGLIDSKANAHWTVGLRSATIERLACGSHALSRPVARELQQRGVRAAPTVFSRSGR